MSTTQLIQLVSKLADRLSTLKLNLGVAESCTGGMLSAALTNLPGSSLWFDRGLITYSNQAKVDLLSVPQKTLDMHGAVSEAVAFAMVEGVLKRHPVSVGIAVTGTAGPDGGTPDKPVGSVWIAWAQKDQPPSAEHFLFKGDRLQIRDQSVVAGIEGLIKRLHI